MSATRRLIKFVLDTGYEQMPGEVIHMAKRCILDCVGVALAGSNDPLGAMLEHYISMIDKTGEATILGAGAMASRFNAALVNGALAHVLDFDDTSYSTFGHPTAPIMPALLSVGEVSRMCGRRILEAFILGFEAECKLGAAVNPSFFEAGWHPMGPLGRVGSVIAVSKLLGLNSEKTESALALACATASGTSGVAGTHAKAMNSGLAAEAGVRSAYLASLGLTGPKGILEKKGGFCDMFSREYDLSKLTGNLGQPFDLVSPGVAFKQYPSCTATHAAIDATLAVRQESGIQPDEVKTIECKTGPWIPRLLVYKMPRNGLEGKFSMPYCLSVALVRGAVRLEDFDDRAVRDTVVMRLLKKVSVETDEELERQGFSEGAVVSIKDKSGRRFERRVNKARGNPENPLPDAELHEKFAACASRRLSPRRVEKLAKFIMSLENIRDIADVTSCTYEPQTSQPG